MVSLVVYFRRHRDKDPEVNSHVSESESKATGSPMETPTGLLPSSQARQSKAASGSRTLRRQAEAWKEASSSALCGRNYVQVSGVLSKGTG